jgi:hypothetical protein
MINIVETLTPKTFIQHHPSNNNKKTTTITKEKQRT